MNLLIVEDEKDLLEGICSYLQEQQYHCEVASDFHTASEKVHLNEYDCIVLDITLPGGSGLELLKQMQKTGKTDSVLIISAKNSVDDKILGLNTGADDYLTKPFHLPELSARIAAIVRRKSFDGKNTIEIDHLTLDLSTKTLSSESGEILLTRKEYELLVYFLSNKNRVITKEAIAQHLWGDNMDMADSYDFIYSHIKNLRKKLMKAGCPDYINSIYGMGYKFVIH